jgi:thymidylate synthase (FAD)
MNIKVLDHGYVRFVESWGRGDAGTPEAGIVEAARQSTQGSFRGWEEDSKLLATLYNHRPPHSTPFEFAGMVIEVQAPIFVFREWHRHRTQSYNEMSARYAPLPDLNYIPSVDRVMSDLLNPSKNKQQKAVKDAVTLTHEYAETFRDQLKHRYADDEIMYQWSLKHGVPKELARLHLPVGRYSKMRAHTCLRNWLAFLTLRTDPDAQWEIRQFALAVSQHIADQFPRTYALYAA